MEVCRGNMRICCQRPFKIAGLFYCDDIVNVRSQTSQLFVLCCSTFSLKIICFRAIHDVKATDMGMSKVRFKAEVDFDGRVVTRSYLEKQDIEQLLQVCLKKNCFVTSSI